MVDCPRLMALCKFVSADGSIVRCLGSDDLCRQCFLPPLMSTGSSGEDKFHPVPAYVLHNAEKIFLSGGQIL